MTEGSQPPFPTSGEPEKPQAPVAPGAAGAEQPAAPGTTPPLPGGTSPPYPPAPRWGAPPIPAQPYTAQQQAAQQQQYAYAPPQPGYPPQYGGHYYQQAPYGYAPGYYPYYTGPDNGLAVASLTVAIIAIVMLFFTAGFSAPVSIVASIIAVVLGLKGKKAVDEGRTRKHRDVALAGFWTGIAGIVLAALAVVAWALIFIFADSGGPAGPGDLSSLARTIIDALAALTA